MIFKATYLKGYKIFPFHSLDNVNRRKKYVKIVCVLQNNEIKKVLLLVVVYKILVYDQNLCSLLSWLNYFNKYRCFRFHVIFFKIKDLF